MGMTTGRETAPTVESDRRAGVAARRGRAVWRAGVLTAGALAGVLALAASQVLEWRIGTPQPVSVGGNGDKPKIQRAGNGRLVVVYGDSPADAPMVYDTKAGVERRARDIYVRSCDSASQDCGDASNWSAPINLSDSVGRSSIATAWRGGDPVADRLPYPGDVDKANLKATGPVMVATWVGHYCPDGDLGDGQAEPAPAVNPRQRAVRYRERGDRVIPFACAWAAYSTDHGLTWRPAVQLSNGERDAKQDANDGNWVSDPTQGSYQTGRVAITWQEDPRGLQLGEAEGPGDGASGARVSNGTDIWYTWATIDLSVKGTPDDDFVLAPPSGLPYARGHRISDNALSAGIGGNEDANPVFDLDGRNVDRRLIETGQAGASRANVRVVGSNVLVAYEETKGSQGLDEGKFIRYHVFHHARPSPDPTATDANDPAGCVVSDPLKNARRVRILAQGASEAGPDGIQLALLWREGVSSQGGPADIVVRRGMGGLQPRHMAPPVDPACRTSDYVSAIALANARGENVSSRASVVSEQDDGLSDDSEQNYAENAMAHRGVLRGNELWIGYSYTPDLVNLWARIDNYDFWIRRYRLEPATATQAATGGWGLPVNLTRIEDKGVNVREPRLFGTPTSSRAGCPSGDPAAADTSDATLCQDRQVLYAVWGTQTNVSPFDPAGAQDLGIHVAVSRDGGASFSDPVPYSTVQGALFDDDETASEAQVVTRPDGRVFFGVWNQTDLATGQTAAELSLGDWAMVDVPPPPSRDDGEAPFGCTLGGRGAPLDPLLPLLAVLAVAGLVSRGRGRR